MAGSASASQTGGLTSRCSVFAAIEIRCVGGALLVTEEAHSVQVSALATVPFDIAPRQFTMNPGDSRNVGIDFGVTGIDTNGDFNDSTGPCFITLTATPVAVTSRQFTWTGSVSDEYATPDNWNPTLCAPPEHNGVRSDTAIFNLSAAPGLGIPLTAGGATARRWIIDGGSAVELNGSPRMLGSSQSEPSLTVRNGGALIIGDNAAPETINADIGNGDLGGRVEVGPAIGKWENLERIKVGGTGNARVEIRDGGRVETADLDLGTDPDEFGTVKVKGVEGINPALLKVNETLSIGNFSGSGKLQIEDGGRVEANDVFVGAGGGPTFQGDNIVISGLSGIKRSTMLVTGELTLAGSDENSGLVVKDGGDLRTFDPVRILRGTLFVNNTASGLTNASGAFWLASEPVTIDGPVGEVATLAIDDDGEVQAVRITLGLGAGRTGRITVQDDARLGATELIVGQNGRGEMTIEDDALVTSQNAHVGVGSSPNGFGFVKIIAPSEWRVAADLNVGFNGAAGLIELDDGVFSSATLTVSGNLAVGARGTIQGNGTLAVPTAQRQVFNGGVIAIGLSPGKIVVEGDYEQSEAGTLVIEIAGLGEGQFDVLKITGNAKLAGTLIIKFIDGFVPLPGDAAKFLEISGGVEGQFGQVVTEGLPEGLEITVDPATGIVTVQITAPPGAQPVCGACGAGVGASLPLMLISLVGVRRGRRRETQIERIGAVR